jgi:ParB-like chromosome segregation protein Spo0J
MNIRNRVKSLRMVPASDLRPNPRNWRTHPKAQADALRGVLAEVGLADACLARELPDGSLMLIDGHLRAETLGDGEVPVLILDVNEDEADKILATLDPLAAMADSDAAKFEELLHTVNTSSQALQELIAETAAQAGLYEDLDKPLSEEGDEPSGEDEADEPPPSGVRMVQLFLDESNIGEFQDACTKLAEEYATENITDTVLEAVRRASASL